MVDAPHPRARVHGERHLYLVEPGRAMGTHCAIHRCGIGVTRPDDNRRPQGDRQTGQGVNLVEKTARNLLIALCIGLVVGAGITLAIAYGGSSGSIRTSRAAIERGLIDNLVFASELEKQGVRDRAERARLIIERNGIERERGRLDDEAGLLVAERARLNIERASLSSEASRLTAERERINRERDALAGERSLAADDGASLDRLEQLLTDSIGILEEGQH